MAHCVDGKISAIGPSGNLVTDILQEQLADAPRDENISIEFAGHQTFGLFDLDHGQPDSTMVAKIGEKGTVEIEIVGLSLSDMLGIGVGELVKVCW